MTALPSPILSRSVSVAEIPAAGLACTIVPTADERAALAAFNGLAAIGAMETKLLLRHQGPQGVHVTGALTAAITQTCVVSLEAFDSAVAQEIDVHFLTPDGLDAFRAALAKAPVDDEAGSPEEPDSIVDGRIDVGALVGEHLTLALDPYPRKPGAALAVDALPADEPISPFAALRELTGKRP